VGNPALALATARLRGRLRDICLNIELLKDLQMKGARLELVPGAVQT
jgi:hypothetical protein